MKTWMVVPGLIVWVAARPALAEDTDTETTVLNREAAPPAGALEVALAAGYSEGVGRVAKGMDSVPQIAGPGGAVEADVGFRISPHLLLGAYVTGAAFVHGTGGDIDSVHSATAGLQANWHFTPERRSDPWVGLASGWRGMWFGPDQGHGTALNGVEIGRLQLGVDFHTEDATISPLLGMDVSMFLKQSLPGQDAQNIDNPRPNVFFFGGLLVRFDVGGRRHVLGQATAMR